MTDFDSLGLAHKRKLVRKNIITLVTDSSYYDISKTSIRLRKKVRKSIENPHKDLLGQVAAHRKELTEYLDDAHLALPTTPELFFLWGLRNPEAGVMPEFNEEILRKNSLLVLFRDFLKDEYEDEECRAFLAALVRVTPGVYVDDIDKSKIVDFQMVPSEVVEYIVINRHSDLKPSALPSVRRLRDRLLDAAREIQRRTDRINRPRLYPGRVKRLYKTVHQLKSDLEDLNKQGLLLELIREWIEICEKFPILSHDELAQVHSETAPDDSETQQSEEAESAWGEVTIMFLSRERIGYKFQDGRNGNRLLSDIELWDKSKGTLNAPGIVLLGMCDSKQYPPSRSKPTPAEKKIASRLRMALKKLTGIQEDPFTNRANNPVSDGYTPKFRSEDRRKIAARRSGDEGTHNSYDDNRPHYDQASDPADKWLVANDPNHPNHRDN